jgi:hypothetical protein
MMCDRCPELEAERDQARHELDAALDELHDLKVAACREAAIDDAQARHPSNADCQPLGIERPLLTLVKIEAELPLPPALALSGAVEARPQVSGPGNLA